MLLPKLYHSVVESVMIADLEQYGVSYYLEYRDLLLGQLSAVMCHRNILMVDEPLVEQLRDLKKVLSGDESLAKNARLSTLVNSVIKAASEKGLLSKLVAGETDEEDHSKDPAFNVNYTIMFGIYSMWITPALDSLPNNLVTNTAPSDPGMLIAVNKSLLPLGMSLSDKSASESKFFVSPSVMITVARNLSKASFYCAPAEQEGSQGIDHSQLEGQEAEKLLSVLGEKARENKLILVPITLPYAMRCGVDGQSRRQNFINPNYSDHHVSIVGPVRSIFDKLEEELSTLFGPSGVFNELAKTYDESDNFFVEGVLGQELTNYLKHVVESILELIDLYNLKV